MDSVELGLDEEFRDQTNEVPKGVDAPRRMPSGTLAPPLHLEPDELVVDTGEDDLEALRAQATLLRSTEAWSELSRTLRRILELGRDALDEQETIDLHAQLGELEGDVLGHVDAAVTAWRAVLALDALDLRALDALQHLLEREGRWEEAIDVIEKCALVLDDEHHHCETLLQAAAIYEGKLDDLASAAAVYERVRRAAPSNVVATTRLEAIYAKQGTWAELVEMLLERSEAIAEIEQQIEILLEVARIYEQELGDEESAFFVLQAAFGRDHAHARCARELERLAAATENWQELVDDTSKRASELEAEDPDAAVELWLKAGRWYDEPLGHVDYAIHSVKQALRLAPQHTRAIAARAELQRKHGRWDAPAVVEPSHEQKTAQYLQVAEAMERQDVAGAIRAYQQALAHEPASREALEALDRLYRRTEAWQPLVGILSRRAELAGDEGEIVRLRVEIGSIHDLRLLDAGAAMAAYEAVLALEPANRAALHALEALYEQAGQHEKCLAIIETELDAATSDADRVGLYERVAAIWEERFGKLDRAAEAYERILEIDARNVPAYHLLERLYQQAGKYDALVATYRNHIAATTEIATRVELYIAIGKLCETRLHSVDDAIQAYDAALSFDGADAQALAALGRLYEQIGDWERAIDALERLVELDAKPDLYCRIGRLQYGKLEDRVAAEASWLRGLALVDDHLPSMQALTELYADRGDWLKAARMMVRAESAAQIPVDKVRLLVQAAGIYQDKLGSADEAKRLYASVIALDPEHVEAGRPLAGLYFEAKQWAELSPVIEMLCRKAGQRKLEPGELHELYCRAGRCADELGATQKALGHYDAAFALDSTHLPTLIGRADLQFKMQDWDSAKKCYQAIVVQHRNSGDPAVVVRSFNRLGRIRLALGERKPALAMFAKVLELEPHHRDTLEGVIEVQSQLGDWDAVVQAKRGLMETADDRERTALANEIAALYRDRLQNAAKATSAYLEALVLAPEDHQLLQKVLDLHIETKRWREAVEIIERFVALESDAFRKGVYFHAAATLCRDELKSFDEAVDFYDCALDSFFAQPERLDDQKLPRALMSFEAIDKILTTKRDWKGQERAYHDMIKRLPNDRFGELRVGLLDGLGEIYRSRLKQYDQASGAFEIAQQLDPDNQLRPRGTDRAEILAELHLLVGPDRADKAIEQHVRMLRREPFKYDSYKALARIYRDTRQYDKHWCMCSTLAFLNKADPDELAFYEQYKPRGLVKAKNVMGPASWAKLAHPDENRYISAIFGACWQSVAAMKAFPHKDFGVKREERLRVEDDQLMFSKLFVYAARALSVVLPDVYLLDDHKPADIQLANTIEKGDLCPSFVVRSHLLQGKSEREVAFLLARKLAFLRPEYFLRMLLPTNAELVVAVLSAIAMVQPRFPVPANLVALVQQYLPEMRKRMSPHATEQLGGVVDRFVKATPEINLARWGHAVDAVSHRAGFVVCGDLAVSARAVAGEPVVLDGPSIKDKVRELVLFSISEEYFAVRAQLGVAIGG